MHRKREDCEIAIVEKKKREYEMERCQKYGESCSYGICDECPVTKGGSKDE